MTADVPSTVTIPSQIWNTFVAAHDERQGEHDCDDSLKPACEFIAAVRAVGALEPREEEGLAEIPLAITTIESTNMGDHGERLTHAHEYIPGETVDALAARLFPRIWQQWVSHDHSDVIEIRAVVPPVEKPTAADLAPPL